MLKEESDAAVLVVKYMIRGEAFKQAIVLFEFMGFEAQNRICTHYLRKLQSGLEEEDMVSYELDRKIRERDEKAKQESEKEKELGRTIIDRDEFFRCVKNIEVSIQNLKNVVDWDKEKKEDS